MMQPDVLGVIVFRSYMYRRSGKGESLVVDTLFDLNLTAKILNGYSEVTTKKPIKTLVNTHSNGDIRLAMN